MADIARGTRVRPVTPVGYEVSDKCELAEDVEAGQLLELTGQMSDDMPVMRLCTDDNIEPAGIALMAGKAGKRGFSVGQTGEMDGFTGLVPDTLLYPSADNEGGISATKPVGAVARMRAVTTSRIRFNFV